MREKPGPEAARSRTLLVLALATAIGSAGLAAGGTAGALLGTQLTGTEAAAGLPLGLLVVGQAAAAVLVSRRTASAGRGRSLALGYVLGALGAVLVILAASVGSFVVLLAGSAVLGAGNTAVFMTRYAAAEIGGEAARGRALGIVFFATALGAVASPGFLGPSGELAQRVGLPPLAGSTWQARPTIGQRGAAARPGRNDPNLRPPCRPETSRAFRPGIAFGVRGHSSRGGLSSWRFAG